MFILVYTNVPFGGGGGSTFLETAAIFFSGTTFFGTSGTLNTFISD